jgi:hypothetical protein
MARGDSPVEIIMAVVVIIILLWLFFGYIFPAFCHAGVTSLCFP